MESTLLSLVVGIASSLLATAFFLSSAETFRRIILPWYADKIYRGVRVDGDWELIELDGVEIEQDGAQMSLSLCQSGDKISGTYSHFDKKLKRTDIYKLTGTIRDRYFMATAVPSSNRHSDGVTFLFYIHNAKSRQVLTGRTLCCAQKGGVEATPSISFAWREP